MFWFRLERSLGHHSLVSTPVKSFPELLPEQLYADEKIAYLNGESLLLAITVSQDYILGLRDFSFFVNLIYWVIVIWGKSQRLTPVSARPLFSVAVK